jgi:Tfp pilus assembly protein PilO
MYTQENRKTLDHVNKKWVKVLTVITYVISVSIVALVLGLYYNFGWKPKYDSDSRFKQKNNDGPEWSKLEYQVAILNVKQNQSELVGSR